MGTLAQSTIAQWEVTPTPAHVTSTCSGGGLRQCWMPVGLDG